MISGIFAWKFWPATVHIQTTQFNRLPGWDRADTKKSFRTFLVSCSVFLKQDPEKFVGTEFIPLHIKDWQSVCRAAKQVNADSMKQTKAFFQQWFVPVSYYERNPVKGLFTGYYSPLFKGSLTKTATYKVPLYGLPRNIITLDLGLYDAKLKNRKLVGRLQGTTLLPYYTREEINQGAIRHHAPVVAWLKSPIDRLFLEIQGSGVIALENGKQMYVGYAGENGAPYTAIAGVLIKRGIFTRDTASMQRIRDYLETHPDQMDSVLNQNKSFVFFHELQHGEALGSQGVSLTPGYSLAIDRNWVPMGAPVWLSTTRPYTAQKMHKTFQRLMIAQDTGGAIKGMVRGDVYWGGGDKATFIAGNMKNRGHYWLLVPRHVQL